MTGISGVIRWEEPPPPRNGQRGDNGERVPWAVIAQELKGQPGRWAVVHEGDPNPKLATRIESGLSPWFRPAGSFEATQRSNGSKVTIYARYVGGDQ
jgi:hypothetical protein